MIWVLFRQNIFIGSLFFFKGLLYFSCYLSSITLYIYVLVVSIPVCSFTIKSILFRILYKQRYIIIFTLRTFILFFYILGLNFNNYIFTNQRQKAEKRDKKIRKSAFWIIRREGMVFDQSAHRGFFYHA